MGTKTNYILVVVAVAVACVSIWYVFLMPSQLDNEVGYYSNRGFTIVYDALPWNDKLESNPEAFGVRFVTHLELRAGISDHIKYVEGVQGVPDYKPIIIVYKDAGVILVDCSTNVNGKYVANILAWKAEKN